MILVEKRNVFRLSIPLGATSPRIKSEFRACQNKRGRLKYIIMYALGKADVHAVYNLHLINLAYPSFVISVITCLI